MADPLAILSQIPQLRQLLDLQVQDAQRTSALRSPLQDAIARLAMNLAPNSAFSTLPSRPTLPSPITTLPSGVNTGSMAPSALPIGAADILGTSPYNPLGDILAGRDGVRPEIRVTSNEQMVPDPQGFGQFFAGNPGGAFFGGDTASSGGSQGGGGDARRRGGRGFAY